MKNVKKLLLAAMCLFVLISFFSCSKRDSASGEITDGLSSDTEYATVKESEETSIIETEYVSSFEKTDSDATESEITESTVTKTERETVETTVTETESETTEITATETESETTEITATETESETTEITVTETESEITEITATETECETTEITVTETESETTEITATETESETTEITAAETESETTEIMATETESETTEITATETESEITEITATETESETTENTETSATQTEIEITETSETESGMDIIESEMTFIAEAEIIEGEGSANVKTADRLEYSAEGYSAIDGSSFAFDGKLTVSFSKNAFGGEFNRVSLGYVSDVPVKCTLTYTQNSVVKSDSFFLEAGEHIFSGLIESYLEGVLAAELECAVFESLSDGGGHFMLYNAACSQVEVFDSEIHYIENERFKLGIRLSWGGGICYVRDKSCPVEKLGNLINIHDAGRLVQQSYYGTAGNDEYKPGIYNGTQWVYNPVQGGDQNWNKSRLIDIKIGENYIYVKAQPQDWSLDNALTPSYMENTYTVYPDRIEVDNRFVDFSGWEHRFAHQELPAFYTVSSLDRFTYYNGLSPWTDDDLIYHDGLPFCDGEEKTQCYFKMLESNSETWCAWINADDDYGIGLYLPEVDMLLAARFLDGHSKNPQDNSCSYVAPVNTLMIKSFVPIEYSYMITAGSVEEMREVFKENKDFSDNEFLSSENSQNIRLPDVDVSYKNIDFSTAEHNKYLTVMNNADMKFNSDHNALELIVGGDDPQINISFKKSPEKLFADNFGKIVIEYMVPVTNSDAAVAGEMFLCAGDTVGAEAGKSIPISYIADGRYHVIELDVSELDFWSGRINSIRFDFLNGGNIGDSLFVKSIKLVQ